MKKIMVNTLTSFGILMVQGPDAKKFLQGQLTCDLDDLASSESSLAAHCNPQGRVVSLFYLAYFKEAYYLLLPSSMLALTLASLKKYAVFYKVEMNEVSANYQIVGYMNEHFLRNENELVIKIPFSKNRYLIMSAITHQLQYEDCLSENDWHLLNIEEGIPAIYPETSAKFLPHEINLIHLHAISLNKGCYTGQEIIARMHYRGKLKKQLYHGQIVCPTIRPGPGLDVYQQTGHDILLVGTIVDVCQRMQNTYDALIVLHDSNETDRKLLLKNNHDHHFFTKLKLMSSAHE